MTKSQCKISLIKLAADRLCTKILKMKEKTKLTIRRFLRVLCENLCVLCVNKIF